MTLLPPSSPFLVITATSPCSPCSLSPAPLSRSAILICYRYLITAIPPCSVPACCLHCQSPTLRRFLLCYTAKILPCSVSAYIAKIWAAQQSLLQVPEVYEKNVNESKKEYTFFPLFLTDVSINGHNSCMLLVIYYSLFVFTLQDWRWNILTTEESETSKNK
jgi:hypothetical protein